MKKTKLLKPMWNLLLLLMAMLVPQGTWALGGSGTSSSPYTISSAADLLKFANIVNGANGETKNISACAKLTADITLSGTWKPIGNSSGHYKGTFDGQGHKISGFSIAGYTAVNSGFFGYVEGAIIKNFTLSGTMSSATQITGGENDCSGAVVARAIGALPFRISSAMLTGHSPKHRSTWVVS